MFFVILPGCIFGGNGSNHPPVIESLSADPVSVEPGGVVTLIVQASDRDGDRLRYLWEATCGNFPDGSQASSVAWQAPRCTCVCTLTAEVSDGKDEARRQIAIQVRESGNEEAEYSYQVVNRYPHDPDAYTQGLVFSNGCLYEGTGLRGESSLRRVDLETGAVLQKWDLPRPYFGEGITLLDDRIIQLTLHSHVGFIYDRETFDSLGVFSYPRDGWGLTHDGSRLITSDGNPALYFLDPETYEDLGEISVYSDDDSVLRLNELEYIDGEVFANVWLTDRIACINPETGRVTAWIDLRGLLTPEETVPAGGVLNGIAWDAENERLFVTGKYWPWVFEIELIMINDPR
ncbi:MAG: glutaminyl-peptide cyclotransferase [Candidatus Eisenbacteria sp.]|nr:glutaminyl-peptide cyclotransferase [Candidatus Eisenbacteria bacterium]